ncbi:histidine kinase [Streptomyces agglomeratus]|uniref:Histidine kinase n=2 Tax=Streptomyces agglomeratus TaxID=285458 RepID=A0A1E5PBR1_9ACTN|nr:histidine kinase [Streptomyces agglomeratus]OEJ58879.1 histidine kinase [Streptomyces agglomeratus]
MNPENGASEALRLPMLLEAVLHVGSDLELRATLQHIVDTATELAGARYGALGVVDPERGGITGLFTSGVDDETYERIGRLPDGHTGLIGHLLRERRPLIVPDVPADVRSAGLPPGHPAVTTFAGVPIRVRTEVFGHLCLAEKRGAGGFTADDLALLRVLASQAGIAIGNARLYDTARRRERWIEGAAACTTALLAGENADDALRTVAEQARILADASAGVVLQPTAEGGMEIVAASTHGDPADLIGTVIEPGSPVLEQLLGGEPVFIEDSATDERMTTRVRARFGPSMMLPLQSGGKLIGTLALPRRRGGPPYSAVDRLLKLLGAAVDELDSTIQEVRTTIFALQQPPADVPDTFRGRVLRETAGAATLLGFQPSVRFGGAVDALVTEPEGSRLLTALRGALAAAHRAGVTAVRVEIDATGRPADGRAAVRLTVTDDGAAKQGRHGTTFTWEPSGSE